MSTPKVLEVEDLKRIWIRTTSAQGLWIQVNCFECSHGAFDRWARGKKNVIGDGSIWPYEERLEFCQLLYDEGSLFLLPA
jgi:hypothetical protein